MNPTSSVVPWMEPAALASLTADGEAARYYASAVRRLDALAFDGENENVRVLLGGPPRDPEAYLAAVADLDRFLSVHPRFPWAYALKGKALLNAGNLAGAQASLDRALGLDAGLRNAYLWRAQASLVAGQGRAAKEDLDRSSSIGGGSAWGYFLKGVSRMTEGDFKGARKEWAKTLRWAPGSVAARAMIGLSLAGEGRPREAARRLEAATRSDGSRSPYLHALNGLVQRQLGDLELSRASLDRALTRAPSPWMFSHRADVLNRLGFYERALQDLSSLSQMDPENADADVQAANVLFDQAFYNDALEAMSRAVEKRPGDPGLLTRQARMLLAASRHEEAVEAVEKAHALAPLDAQIQIERIQILVLAGRLDEAEQALRKRRWAGSPFGRLMGGILACRRADYAGASRRFQAARKAAELRGDPLAARAGLYAMVSRLLAEEVRAAGSRHPAAGLHLLSVGVRHPFQVTVEVVRTLAHCSEVYTNVPDPEVREFLCLFPGRVVGVPRLRDQPDLARARWIMDRVRSGSRVGFVTRIHPFMYRRIGFDLVGLCRERAVAFHAYAAVSLTELAAGLAAEGGAHGRQALRVFDISAVNRRPALLDSSQPAVIYCIGTESERLRLCGLLRSRYPRGHGAFLLGGSGDREQAAPRVPLTRLPAALAGADTGCVLYVPSAGEERC